MQVKPFKAMMPLFGYLLQCRYVWPTMTKVNHA